MRILLVNKFFRSFGGSEATMFRQADLLRAGGHEVAFFSMDHPDNHPSEWSRFFVSNVELSGTGKVRAPWRRLRAAARFFHSPQAKRKMLALIDEFKPDAAVCHNIYHQLSPSVLVALRSEGVRTLLYLHDYKLVCPNYRLLAHDGLCERCIGGHFTNAVKYRCVGDSKVESALCAAECWYHRLRRSYLLPDVLMSPSEFLISRVRGDPVYADAAMVHLPIGLDLGPRPPPVPTRGYALFVGLLNRVKGAHLLVEAAAKLPEHSFVIVGDGPEEGALRALAEKLGTTNVRFTGRLQGEALAEAYRGAACLVMPSTWYENSPGVIVEAAGFGRPAVASNIGGMAELVDDGITGYHFRAGDSADLADKLSCLLTNPDVLEGTGRMAREKAETEWSLERHYERLLALCKGEPDSGVGPGDRVRWHQN